MHKVTDVQSYRCTKLQSYICGRHSGIVKGGSMVKKRAPLSGFTGGEVVFNSTYDILQYNM